jgi:hypothetical protein
LFGRTARNQRCYDQERGKGNDRFHISRANSISLLMQIQIAHDASAKRFGKEALDSDSFRATSNETNESSIRRFFCPAL